MHALAAAAPQRAAPRAVPPTGPPRTASRVARHRPSPPPQALRVRAALRAGPALRLRAAPRPRAAFRVLCVGPTDPERRPCVVLHLGTFGERGRAVARTYIARFNLGEAVRSARRSRPQFPPAVPARPHLRCCRGSRREDNLVRVLFSSSAPGLAAGCCSPGAV